MARNVFTPCKGVHTFVLIHTIYLKEHLKHMGESQELWLVKSAGDP